MATDPDTPDLAALTDDTVVDRAVLLQRFASDMQLLLEVAEIFLAECPQRLAALRDSLARRDCRGLEWAAHSIRGSATSFAAGAVVGAAQAVEQFAHEGDAERAASACAALEAEVDRLREVLVRLRRNSAA